VAKHLAKKLKNFSQGAKQTQPNTKDLQAGRKREGGKRYIDMLQARPICARRVAFSCGSSSSSRLGGGSSSGVSHHHHQQQQQQQKAARRMMISRHLQCSAQAAIPTRTHVLETSEQQASTHQRPISVIRKIRESLISRERTAVEITEGYLAKLQEREPHIRSFLHISAEKALLDADEIDKLLSEGGGGELGLLAGVPLGVKDNLCTRDMPSTGGSQILKGYCPPYDATAVCKLREAGAVLVGKTNMDEFGMGSSTESSAYQVPYSPPSSSFFFLFATCGWEIDSRCVQHFIAHHQQLGCCLFGRKILIHVPRVWILLFCHFFQFLVSGLGFRVFAL
jgi:hypothetical protein